MKNKILPALLIAFLCTFTLPSFAQTEESFNLAGVIESIINYQNQSDIVSDIRFDSKENFLNATNKFMQGNVVVAYGEYSKTIETLDKNIALLMLSKKLYEYGFFTLGDFAVSKISGRHRMTKQIENLKEAYKPSYSLTKDEENYLAKAYTSIYFNNSPEEVAFNLIKKTSLLENSDYANFILAQSMYECRQYQQALIYINKAIDKNDVNSNYKCFKLKAMIAFKQYKEALKYIEELEKENKISVYFKNDFDILKQQVLFNLTDNDSDKKFHQIYQYYLAGNYYKTLKETQNILNFNKNNPKILTLQAMSHLALGDIESAKDEFNSSYKLDKKFDLTLMGLADSYFIDKNYDEALKYYKKLNKTTYNDEAILKTALIYEIQNIKNSKSEKNEKLKAKIVKNCFYENYLIANNLLFDDERLKKKYTAKSIALNPLYTGGWDILYKINYQNKDFRKIDTLTFLLSFLDEPNAEYYYYSALSLDNSNNKKDAFYEVKKALSVNPDFKPAVELMNKLQNELI